MSEIDIYLYGESGHYIFLSQFFCTLKQMDGLFKAFFSVVRSLKKKKSAFHS